MTEPHDTPEEVELLPMNPERRSNSEIYRSNVSLSQRDKWKKRWAAMDEEDCTGLDYKYYEASLRKTFEELEIRERQLKAALAADKEKDAEIERLKSYRSWDRIHELESQLSALRASVGGEKWTSVEQGQPPMNIHEVIPARYPAGNPFLFDRSGWFLTWNPKGLSGNSSLQSQLFIQQRLSYIKKDEHWVHGGVTYYLPIAPPTDKENPWPPNS